MSKLISTLSERARTRLEEPEVDLEMALNSVLDEELEAKPIPEAEEQLLRTQLTSNMAAYGPLQSLLDDPSVEEIWVNSDQEVFIARSGISARLEVAIDQATLSTIIEKMLRHTGRRLDRTSPFVDASLPDGSRLHAVIPDITRRHWSVNIRKFPAVARKLADLTSLGSINMSQQLFLSDAMKQGKNILVSGATQAGKTTLLCALLQEVAKTERIVSVEETFEINIQAADWVALQTRQPNLEGVGEISLRRLVKESLRMRPGRIVVGEVREAESFDLLIALNSGLPGLCTIHANSAKDAITKLCTLPLLAGGNISSEFVEPTVGNCIDLVVHARMEKSGQRRVQEIIKVDWNSKTQEIDFSEVRF